MIKLPMKSFYFMRHGETDWNNRHIAMGQSDIPLNERGVEQAYKAADLLKSCRFSAIAVSPLKRARQTADIIAKKFSATITIIEELKECSWGVMEGQHKGDGSWLEKWRKNSVIKEAEIFSSFTKRVMRGLEKALEYPEEPVLVIAHGGVYWDIQEALNLPFVDLPNCIPLYHRPPIHENNPWFVCNVDEEEIYGNNP